MLLRNPHVIQEISKTIINQITFIQDILNILLHLFPQKQLLKAINAIQNPTIEIIKTIQDIQIGILTAMAKIFTKITEVNTMEEVQPFLILKAIIVHSSQNLVLIILILDNGSIKKINKEMLIHTLMIGEPNG